MATDQLFGRPEPALSIDNMAVSDKSRGSIRIAPQHAKHMARRERRMVATFRLRRTAGHTEQKYEGLTRLHRAVRVVELPTHLAKGMAHPRGPRNRVRCRTLLCTLVVSVGLVGTHVGAAHLREQIMEAVVLPGMMGRSEPSCVQLPRQSSATDPI